MSHQITSITFAIATITTCKAFTFRSKGMLATLRAYQVAIMLHGGFIVQHGCHGICNGITTAQRKGFPLPSESLTCRTLILTKLLDYNVTLDPSA